MSFLLLPVLLLSLTPSSVSAPFTCTKSTSTCQSLIGYTPQNATTLAAIKSLFGVKSLRSLIAANNLPLSTPSSHPITSTIRIRFNCKCLNGSGTASRKPVYKVRPGDGLDFIARNIFNGFVTYQEIAAANGISNPSLIEVGQKLEIPLPCSCDEVGGQSVVHYGHVVEAGSSVEEIGAEFGVPPATLMQVNGIKDPKLLQAGEILDVPLRACSSSISNSSLDRGLLIPNSSYILTANNCVRCSCSSLTWQLDCATTQGISSGVCPAAKCGNMDLGNSSSISTCKTSVCAYGGYTNNTILTSLTTHSTCNNGSAPSAQPSTSRGSALRLGMGGLKYDMELLILPFLVFILSPSVF